MYKEGLPELLSVVNLSVEINKLPIWVSDCDMLVIPVHVSNVQKTWNRYPIDEMSVRFPLAYGHFKKMQDAAMIEPGVPVVTVGLESKDICWLPITTDARRRYKIEWIERGVRKMAAMRLHVSHSIAFPALGVYEGEGVDPTDVYKIVSKTLGPGSKKVEFLLNF